MRLLVSPNKKYFLKQPMNWIDFLSMIPSYIVLIFPNTWIKNLIIIRLLRLFRFFKLSYGLQVMLHTLKASSYELVLLLLILLIPVVIFSSLVYAAEFHISSKTTGETTKFTSIPQTFWWCLITMTTVGYGDFYPKTWPGQIIGSVCAICGLLIVALPISVIGSNFNLYYAHVRARLSLPKKNRTLLQGNLRGLLKQPLSLSSRDRDRKSIRRYNNQAIRRKPNGSNDKPHSPSGMKLQLKRRNVFEQMTHSQDSVVVSLSVKSENEIEQPKGSPMPRLRERGRNVFYQCSEESQSPDRDSPDLPLIGFKSDEEVENPRMRKKTASSKSSIGTLSVNNTLTPQQSDASSTALDQLLDERRPELSPILHKDSLNGPPCPRLGECRHDTTENCPVADIPNSGSCDNILERGIDTKLDTDSIFNKGFPGLGEFFPENEIKGRTPVRSLSLKNFRSPSLLRRKKKSSKESATHMDVGYHRERRAALAVQGRTASSDSDRSEADYYFDVPQMLSASVNCVDQAIAKSDTHIPDDSYYNRNLQVAKLATIEKHDTLESLNTSLDKITKKSPGNSCDTLNRRNSDRLSASSDSIFTNDQPVSDQNSNYLVDMSEDNDLKSADNTDNKQKKLCRTSPVYSVGDLTSPRLTNTPEPLYASNRNVNLANGSAIREHGDDRDVSRGERPVLPTKFVGTNTLRSIGGSTEGSTLGSIGELRAESAEVFKSHERITGLFNEDETLPSPSPAETTPKHTFLTRSQTDNTISVPRKKQRKSYAYAIDESQLHRAASDTDVQAKFRNAVMQRLVYNVSPNFELRESGV